MAWIDRLQTAAYISPSGIRFEFLYENVSMESDKKTGEFIFPEIEGQYIQDLGRAGRRFPFTLFFSGEDHDIQANNFLAALEEPGAGTLEHPLYGTRKVVPTGTITRNDNLVTGANQTIFSITFSETLLDINFPSSELNEKIEIQNGISELNDNTSDQYENDLDIENESESIELQSDLIEKKDFLTNALSALTNLNENIKNAMDSVDNALNNSILNLITDPGGIASQILTLINTPSNIVTNYSAYIEGYGSVINNIVNSTVNSINQYHNAFLFLSGCMGALSSSMLNAEFSNRPQAIDALEKIEEFESDIKDWIDENIVSLSVPDTGEIYSEINNIVASTLGYLVRLSFDLPKKIYLTLKEDRQLIELVSELYEDLDQIDFFIQTNSLTTDEIELLPMGKEVIYFE